MNKPPLWFHQMTLYKSINQLQQRSIIAKLLQSSLLETSQKKKIKFFSLYPALKRKLNVKDGEGERFLNFYDRKFCLKIFLFIPKSKKKKVFSIY